MPIPIQRVIEGRRKVMTVREDQSVSEALELMLGNSFNQLPVVDADNHLKGLISSRSILRTYYHSTGKAARATRL
jgi:CBS domain-containing protein